MKEEIESRFKVMHGAPPLAATAYKEQIMDLFVSHGSHLAARRVLLALCPNGDWRSQFVEFYAPAFCKWSREEMLNHVTSGTIAAMCAAQPTMYKRARWTGADLATDCLGVLEACHRLLSSTFLRFAAHYERGGRADVLLGAAAAVAGSTGDGVRPHVPDFVPPIADESVGASSEPLALPGGASSSLDDVLDPRMEAPNWQAINASHRRIAAQWLGSKPFGMLAAQRRIMEPLRKLLAKQLTLSSEEWELEQRSIIAERLKQGRADWQDRQYRLAVAACGTDEDAFFQDLTDAYSDTPFWELLPTSDHTEEFRATVFRLLSRCGSAVFELIAAPHKEFPIQMFRLLADKGAAEDLRAAPNCLLDTWSAEIRRLHPSLSGADLFHKLALLGQLCHKDIAQVEARHATIRRILMAASMHTHTQAFQDLSASWTFLQFRKRSFKMKRASTKFTSQRKTKVACASLLPSHSLSKTSCQGVL